MGVTPATLIRNARRASGLTQAELAARLGTTQPEIARLESPRANPTYETLADAIAATGHELVFELAPDRSGIDEAQILDNLKLTPAERLDRLADAQRNIDELARSAKFRDG